MKKFFKSLALVLALVLIVGSLPMNNAKAADITLKKTAKTLWWNPGEDGKNIGAIGTTADGTASPKFRGFAVKVLNAGEAKITGKSDNKAVAKFVNGKIWAKGAGEAVVTIFADGEEVGNIKVTVKTPSKSVKINDPGVTVIGIGEKVLDLGLTKDGTDHTTYKLTAGADIATIDEKGVITTKQPGEIKVQAYSYQGSKYNAPIAKSEELTLKVAAALESVKQISSKKVALTFDSEMDAAWVKTDKVEIYSKSGEAKIVVYKQDGAVNKDNKKEVTFEAYNEFAGEKEYFVSYDGKEIPFTAAKLTPENAKSIVITTTEIVAGAAEPAQIAYKVVDANGIEIEGAKAYVTFDLADKMYAAVTAAGGLTIFQVDKVANVKAKYSYGYFAGSEYKKVEFEATAAIKGVKKADSKVVDVKWSIGNLEEPNWDDKDDIWTTLAVGDNYQPLWLNIKCSDGTTDTYLKNADLTIESTDNTTALVTEEAGLDGVYPIKAGSVTILVKQAGNVIANAVLNIGAKRQATTLEITASQDNLNTATFAGFEDEVTYKATLKDQYGDDMLIGANELKVSTLAPSGVSSAAIEASMEAHKGLDSVTIKGNDDGIMNTKGTIGFSFQVEKAGVKTNQVVKYLSVNAVTGTANGYAIITEDSDAKSWDATVDTAYEADDAFASIEVGYQATKDGYKIDDIVSAPVSGIIKYDVYGLNNANAVIDGVILASYNDAGVVKKLAPNTYTIRLFNGNSIVASKTFTVVDTQKTLSVAQTRTSVAGVNVKDCFTVKYNNVDVTAACVFGTVDGNGYVYVSDVVFDIGGENGVFSVKAPIGKTLTK